MKLSALAAGRKRTFPSPVTIFVGNSKLPCLSLAVRRDEKWTYLATGGALLNQDEAETWIPGNYVGDPAGAMLQRAKSRLVPPAR